MANNQQRTNIWIDGSQAGATLTELKKKVAILNKEIKDLPRNSDDYKKKVLELKDAGSALDSHRKQIKGVADSYNPAKTGLKGLIGQFAPMAGGLAVAGMAISGVVAGIRSWYQNNKEMEKSLSSLRSLTGASTEDIKFYKAQAIEMGKSSTMSASQVVEGFKLIGSARPDLLKNKEALAEVTKETIVLAEAAEMDLGAAAQSLAGSMNQFNLGAEHSGRIINALAAGSKEGAAEIVDVTDSIDKFGTVAASNNITFEESVALTELMAEKNIKGAEAGTQLRNVLLNVSTASALPKEALLAMQQYGVDLSVVTNKALPLKDRLTEMAKVQGDQNALLKIFGKENVVAGQTILGNINKFDTLTKAVTGTNTAYEQQSINNDNLDGDLKKLGSAWEGVTLSMEGGSSILRKYTQMGADFLNWISLTITAFSEWDTTKMETSLLQFLNYFPGINLLFGDFLDHQIRMNQLTSAVIDGMKEQANSSTILTESLKQNNLALENGNLSAEETKRIQDENAKIIGKLNEQYPELTSNMDLNTASSEDLSKLQKQINANLLQQSIAAVQAAEAERILSEIVQNSMKIAEQRAKEKKRWAVTNWIADRFAEDAEDMKQNNDKLKDQLKSLPKTMKEVEASVKDVNPQFGTQFKEQTNVMYEAWKDILRIKKELETATGSNKKALEAELKGARATFNNMKQKNKELKNGVLAQKEATDETIASEEKLTKTQAKNYKEQEKNKKTHEENMKKMEEELTKLIKDSEKLQTNINNQKILDGYKSEKEKELWELQNSLDQKYQAEIDMALKLSQDKTEIGERADSVRKKATEQLDALNRIKKEELEQEKYKIEEKYRKQAEKEDKEANEKALEQLANLEEAKSDLKVTRAKLALSRVREGDLSGYRKAKEDLEQALEEQNKLQEDRKLLALKKQLDLGQITEAEYNARALQLAEQHELDLQEIKQQSAEKLKAIDNERFQNTLSNISQIIDISKQFSEANTQTNLKNLKTENTKEQKLLDEKLRNKQITETQYQEQKQALEKDYANRKYQIELKQFQTNKAFSMASAVVETAMAILKTMASIPYPANIPLAVLQGVAGAAQLATISATAPPEAPQFFSGGYSDVTGATDGLRYRAKNVGRMRAGLTPSTPSLALVSERGPEYFVPNGLLRNQKVARHVAMIEAVRTNQYAEGGFTTPMSISAGNDDLINIINQNTMIMNLLASQIPNMGVTFTDKNIEDLEKNTTRVNSIRS
jgi:TP901 family phage tail tape measure protein